MKTIIHSRQSSIFANGHGVSNRSRTSFWKTNFENYSRIGPITRERERERAIPSNSPLSRRCRITDPTSCEWRYRGAFDASGGWVTRGRLAETAESVRYSILRLCLPTGTPRWLVIRIHLPNAKDDTERSGSHAARKIQPLDVRAKLDCICSREVRSRKRYIDAKIN